MAWGEAKPVWRTARKQFACAGNGCTRSIEPGDRYLDQTQRDLEHAHYRYCQPCGKLIEEQVEYFRLHIGRGENDFFDRYQQHIASTAWKNLRAEVIELRGYRCQRCQRCQQDKPGLALHHVHYRTLGHETPDDVELLCAVCHEIADFERSKHNSLGERMKREAQSNGQ